MRPSRNGRSPPASTPATAIDPCCANDLTSARGAAGGSVGTRIANIILIGSGRLASGWAPSSGFDGSAVPLEPALGGYQPLEEGRPKSPASRKQSASRTD